jgi:hypothetical protein
MPELAPRRSPAAGLASNLWGEMRYSVASVPPISGCMHVSDALDFPSDPIQATDSELEEAAI